MNYPLTFPLTMVALIFGGIIGLWAIFSFIEMIIDENKKGKTG